MMGNTDIHQPIVGTETTAENHRPMTLVFAEEKSIKALKEALVAGRTAVWFKNELIGRPKYLRAIFRRALQVDKPYRTQGDTTWFEVTNNSDIDIQIQRVGESGPEKLTLPANAITMIETKVDTKAEQAELRCQVTNFLVAPDRGLPVKLTIPLQ